MAYEQKPNSGSLWQNDKKTEDKHPDRTGTIMLECPACQAQWEAFLDGWLKKTGAGKQFLSVRVKAKTKKGGQHSESQQQQQPRRSTTDF